MAKPDRYVFDLNAPHPNVDIDTMRRAVVQAVSDLGDRRADVDDCLYLVDVVFDLIDSTLADVADAATGRQQLRTDLDALTARVAALEPPPADPPLEAP
jgi:hypothetical protein